MSTTRSMSQLMVALVVLILGIAMPADASVSGPAKESPEGVRRLGVLPYPKDKTGPPAVVAIDDPSRRMYAVYAAPSPEGRIVEYDLTRRVPALRREARIPVSYNLSKAKAALDSTGQRLFYLDFGAPEGCDLCSVLRVLDIRTLKVQASYNLTTLIPNFFGQGLTYSAADRLLYLTGSHLGAPTAFVETTAMPAYPLSVAAFDPDAGSPVWWKVVPQCLHPMSGFPAGAVIARSPYQNALYTGCVRADLLNAQANYPGQSGLVRVWFTPRGDLLSAAAFPVEFFPISGTYTNGEGVSGLADYDPVADRFYMLSQSYLTPGVWVFDGRDSAWVGFIPAVAQDDAPMGVDPASGRLFLATGTVQLDPEHFTRGLIVADGRSTPVAQGQVFPIAVGGDSPIPFDPRTRRLFVFVIKDGGSNDVEVLADETATAAPPLPTEYDALTTDVAEGPNTEVAYSGSLNGFGSRVVLVGGTGGIVASTGRTAIDLSAPPVWDRGYVYGLSPGDRGMFLGHVGSVDLRNSGATGSAQAVTPDSQTANEYINKQHELYAQLGDSDRPPEPWPWPVAVCLDGENKPSTEGTSGLGTETKASCDLKNAAADARSATGDVALSEDVSIGGSSFAGSAVRAAGQGIVTTATAIAREIEITVPGAGSLTIGRIKAVARTSAQGRRGSARVEWTRDIDHVAVTDASGKPVFSCASQCETAAIEAAVHEWAGAKIAIKFPTPRTRATPGGAFAEVQKTDAAYYDGFTVNNDETSSSPAAEILVYNDYGERSRLLIQLAAIQASSIYGISVLPTDSGLLPELPPLPPPVGDVLAPTVPLPPPISAPEPTQGGSFLERVIRSSRFLVRSPGDALLIGLIATLSLGALAACWRRRGLLGLLDDFGSRGGS